MGVLAVLAPEVEVELRRDRSDIGVRDIAAKAREVRDDRAAPPAAELGELAGDVADALLDRDGIPVGVETEDRGCAARGVAQAHEELDRRRLARPVRSEEAEDLALVHVDIEVEDPVPGAVVLRQLGCLDSERHDRLGIPAAEVACPA